MDPDNHLLCLAWSLLQSSLLVSPHLRSLEPSTLAPRARPRGYRPRERHNSDFVDADDLCAYSHRFKADIHRFSQERDLEYHYLGNAARVRHGNVVALDRSRHASFAKAQDATNEATDSRR